MCTITFTRLLRPYAPLKKSLRQLMLTSHNIKDRIGIVTGGADGIGLACAKELLRQGVQVNVIMSGLAIGDVGREKECMEELKQFGEKKVLFKKCDVTNKDQLEDLFKAAIDKFKHLDFVINNAGILNDGEWEREIATNVTACVRGTFLGLKHMALDKGGKGGAIVNVASILGLQHFAGSPVYVGTKHFLVGFDRSVGDYYHFKRTGVRILTMCPGVTLTPMITNADKYAFKKFEPNMGKLLSGALASLPPQGSDDVGRHMIVLLTMGPPGSVWVSEGGEFYEVAVPDRKTMRKKN